MNFLLERVEIQQKIILINKKNAKILAYIKKKYYFCNGFRHKHIKIM